MWLAGVWNPFLEFPDLLQVLQEKVRQNVIWGYEKASPRRRCFFVLCPAPVACGATRSSSMLYGSVFVLFGT